MKTLLTTLLDLIYNLLTCTLNQWLEFLHLYFLVLHRRMEIIFHRDLDIRMSQNLTERSNIPSQSNAPGCESMPQTMKI